MSEELLQQLIKENDIPKILQFGQKHGFFNNFYRKQIYPKLLQIEDLKTAVPYSWLNPISICVQNDQIQKDVVRSMNTIDICQSSADRKEENQSKLYDILDSIFLNLPNYSYYQGYHDIVTIFMAILGTDLGFYASQKAAHLFFRDYLQCGFEHSVLPQLSLMHLILKQYSRDTSDHFFVNLDVLEELPQLTFPIPWLLTWFSHSLSSFRDICQLWDFLICSQQNAIIYLCCAFVIFHKDHILQRENMTEDIVVSLFTLFDYQIGSFQFYFQSLETKENNINEILKITSDLINMYPFEQFIKNKPVQFYPEQTLFHLNVSSLVFSSNFQSSFSSTSSKKGSQNRWGDFLARSMPKIKYFALQGAGVLVGMILHRYLNKTK